MAGLQPITGIGQAFTQPIFEALEQGRAQKLQTAQAQKNEAKEQKRFEMTFKQKQESIDFNNEMKLLGIVAEADPYAALASANKSHNLGLDIGSVSSKQGELNGIFTELQALANADPDGFEDGPAGHLREYNALTAKLLGLGVKLNTAQSRLVQQIGTGIRRSEEAQIKTAVELQGIKKKEGYFLNKNWKRIMFPTLDEIEAKGLQLIPPGAQKNIISMRQAMIPLNKLNKLSQELFHATGRAGVIGQRISASIESILPGGNAKLKTYIDTLPAAATKFAKAAGEVGVLTDWDIKRFTNAMPNETDTVESARLKMSIVRSIIEHGQTEILNFYSGKGVSDNLKEKEDTYLSIINELNAGTITKEQVQERLKTFSIPPTTQAGQPGVTEGSGVQVQGLSSEGQSVLDDILGGK